MGEQFKNIHNDIIERCKLGDHYAQNNLYKLYSRAMFNVCHRIVNDFDDAEDILQESFISVFKNLRYYKGEASFGAWLKRIVINKSISFLKKRRIEMVHIDDDIDQADEPTSQKDHVDIIDFKVKRIKSALRKLPDGYRMVFSLYLIEGYDHAEIAAIMNISKSTSKSQFNRSKKKLKEILQKENDLWMTNLKNL